MTVITPVFILPYIVANFSDHLLLFDAISLDKPFRCIKLRGKNEMCALCGTSPTITQLIDYEVFCSSKATDKVRVRKNIIVL